MATNARVGIGSVLRRWNTDGTTGVWEEIVEVTNLDWDGSSREAIEVFKLNNADDYMNKLQGVLNANSVTATILYTQAEFLKLKADQETRGNQDYQLELPDGSALEWEGFITELPLSMGSGDAIQGDVVFEIDGKPDFVSSASASA